MIGIDIVNDYYDPALKASRLATFDDVPDFRFEKMDIADAAAVAALIRDEEIVRVVHLAAQAGVRCSRSNPFAYQHSNLAGHLSVMEACRHRGGVRTCPSTPRPARSTATDRWAGQASPRRTSNKQVSLYAATKRSCELMSQSYAALYGLAQTGLRFFTVYGPWGRPDMAYFSFTQKILAGETIEVFGEGKMARDFTYVDDIVDGIVGALDHPPEGAKPDRHRVLNIGDSHPVGLMEMIETLERALGVEANKVMRPMQQGDVTATYADVSELHRLTGYRPKVMLEEGLNRFAAWYRDYYRV
ncbi:NAD-dependent epimerase/dehydratase family protein [Sphingomonas sp. MMS24-JH45]